MGKIESIQKFMRDENSGSLLHEGVGDVAAASILLTTDPKLRAQLITRQIRHESRKCLREAHGVGIICDAELEELGNRVNQFEIAQGEEQAIVRSYCALGIGYLGIFYGLTPVEAALYAYTQSSSNPVLFTSAAFALSRLARPIYTYGVGKMLGMDMVRQAVLSGIPGAGNVLGIQSHATHIAGSSIPEVESVGRKLADHRVKLTFNKYRLPDKLRPKRYRRGQTIE